MVLVLGAMVLKADVLVMWDSTVFGLRSTEYSLSSDYRSTVVRAWIPSSLGPARAMSTK